MSDFKPDAHFDYVFAEESELIKEQRAEFLENLKGDADNG